MSDNTKIEWADSSWPVVTGCTHISSGCDNCYAARLTSGRLKHLPAYAGLAEGGRFNGTVRCLPDRLGWPLKWRKPRRIFVSDMADLFHDGVPDEYIAQVFAVMAVTPHHTYQVLTKRHARMRSLLSSSRFRKLVENRAWKLHEYGGNLAGWPLANTWIGVSAEDQHWYDIRWPALEATPAAVRFLSLEPLLGPVDLGFDHDCGDPPHMPCPPRPDWVIVGGESGPGARRCELGWIEDIVNQCHAEAATIFVKQFGSVLGREFGAGSHGADMDHWPAYLQHRQFPATHEVAA